MAGYFSGGKIIKVNIANGSRNNIWCRVADDKALKVQVETGGGLDVHNIGVTAQKACPFLISPSVFSDVYLAPLDSLFDTASSSVGCNIIKVNFSNGSPSNIWCRIAGDKALKEQGTIGSGLNVYSIGFNSQNAAHFHHVAGATRGYSQIQKGNTLEFESSTSSNSVYMTIICESGRLICKNHEITKSRNYLLTKFGALVDAKQNQMWIDKNESDHKVTYDCKWEDDDYCNPESYFSDTCW